jgi:hypothetical protein
LDKKNQTNANSITYKVFKNQPKEENQKLPVDKSVDILWINWV